MVLIAVNIIKCMCSHLKGDDHLLAGTLWTIKGGLVLGLFLENPCERYGKLLLCCGLRGRIVVGVLVICSYVLWKQNDDRLTLNFYFITLE